MTDDDPADEVTITVSDEAAVQTVENALVAARREEGVETDAEALVELAASYTGWPA